MKQKKSKNRELLPDHYLGPLPDTKEARSFWRKLWQGLFPHLAEKWELGNRFLESEVRVREEQAGLQAAQTDQTRQQALKDFCEVVDQNFGPDSDAAKRLKLAKLLAANPEIEAQIEKVVAIAQALAAQHGTKIEVLGHMLPPSDPADPNPPKR